jgi:hypothetical protein
MAEIVMAVTTPSAPPPTEAKIVFLPRMAA